MANVSTYLNFSNYTEEVFNFYKSVFGGEFTVFQRFSDVANLPGAEKMTEQEKKGILHIELPILGGHKLMGTDAPQSMGFNITFGNNISINLEPDSLDQGKKLFESLSVGGKIEMPLEKMFWGDYFGSFTDKYGVKWMVNVSEK